MIHAPSAPIAAATKAPRHSIKRLVLRVMANRPLGQWLCLAFVPSLGFGPDISLPPIPKANAAPTAHTGQTAVVGPDKTGRHLKGRVAEGEEFDVIVHAMPTRERFI